MGKSWKRSGKSLEFKSLRKLVEMASTKRGESLRKKSVKSMSDLRLPIPEYAMMLAQVASMRSEDPYRKVGAAALDFDNRVIGTAYNGLAPGFKAPEGFWDQRDGRQKFMLHAEVNLCSLFKRGEAKLIATTTMPCTACMQTLCAYGVKEIYYMEEYHQSDAPEIAQTYGIILKQIKASDLPMP